MQGDVDVPSSPVVSLGVRELFSRRSKKEEEGEEEVQSFVTLDNGCGLNTVPATVVFEA